MSKLEKKNHYERVFSVDDEGNITSWGLKSKREEIVIQERKELTDKQRAYLNRNDELKTLCCQWGGKGGHVHMYYIRNKLLFNELNLSRSNISRLIYISTFIDYNNREENVLVRRIEKDGDKYIRRKDIQELLGISSRATSSFIKEMKENNLIFEANKKFYISSEYFSKGECKFDKGQYTRLFSKSIRALYENTPNNKHKQLSYVYQLLPYVNVYSNVLCSNPCEHELDNINKLTLDNICQLLDTSLENKYRLEKDLLKFTIEENSKTHYVFAEIIVKTGQGEKEFFAINPMIAWAGNDVSLIKEVVGKLVFG